MLSLTIPESWIVVVLVVLAANFAADIIRHFIDQPRRDDSDD